MYDPIGFEIPNHGAERAYTMKEYRKLSHTTYLCKYHVVLCPKYRYRILYGKIGQKVRDWIRRICEMKGVDIEEGHVSKDHVHLYLSIPPKFAVSEVVGTIKGRVAVRMFKDFPGLRKKFWGKSFWGKGYFVSTVGINEDVIRKYIQTQEIREKEARQQGFDW